MIPAYKSSITVLFMCVVLLSVCTGAEPASSHVLSKNEQIIRFIAGEMSEKDYETRAAAVHKLNNYLTNSEVLLIKAFLYQKHTELTNLEFNSIKNDLVIVLMRQRKTVTELGEWLIEMFSDETFGDTWRDYCIQFIGQLYPECSPERKKKMLTVLTKALNERSNGIAGTALIALNRNSSDSLIDGSKLGKTACEIASKDETPEYLKITAVQIAALHGEREVLSICDKIIDSEKSEISTQLKMSAIAAVGILRSEERLEKIRLFENSSDVRLSQTAKSAIEKIKNNKGRTHLK